MQAHGGSKSKMNVLCTESSSSEGHEVFPYIGRAGKAL